MDIFEQLAAQGHEQVAFWSEPEVGYRGIIAIHDTSLGPALGGIRFWDYPTEGEALTDVPRLAEGMSYKAAIAGLDLGGGKSVIIGDPRTRRRELILRAHGRLIESLGGRYIAAEDVGTTVNDMEFVRMETEWVTGLRDRSGDPSPVTAYGTYHGMRACAHVRYGEPALAGRHVAVQGVGNVGSHLCTLLAEEGARLTITDLDGDRAKRVAQEIGATTVDPDEIYSVQADIFAPCALGAVVNDRTLELLQVDIVAGAANNQLAAPHHGEALQRKGILYAPDYVINAGGMINVYGELHEWSAVRARRKAAEIFETLLEVFESAENEGVAPAEAAGRLAKDRILQVRHLRRSWV